MDLQGLDWKEYRYTGQIKQRGGLFTLRPQLFVKLTYAGRSETTMGLVDSGGDFTLINKEFADVLGIDLSACEVVSIGGVGGTGIEGRLATIRMSLEDFDEEYHIQARFVSGLPIDILLGQSDFFEHFKILFDRRKRKFFLARNKS